MPEGSKFRDFRGIDGVVKDAVSGTEGTKKATEKAEKSVRRSNAVSAEQALKTERPAKKDEGVRSFGAPLSTGADDVARKKNNQSTDSKQ